MKSIRKPPALTVSTKRNHRERIYDLFVDRIQRGEIGAEDRLVDTVIAAELGVSRMPVREALMQLAHEGFLEPTTRGFTLPTLRVQDVLEVFDLRRLLEPRAVALATQAMTAAALAAIRDAVEDGEATLSSNDKAMLFRSAERFRNGWLAVVPNAALRSTIQRYLAQVQAVRMATMRDLEAHRIIVAGQRTLLGAFAARDAVAAQDHMLAYVISGEAKYRAAMGL